MTDLQDRIRNGELDQLLSDGYICTQVHPEADLRIFNYTPKAQYEREWSPLTKACRGLIVTSGRAIHARPFPKFFNLGEHEPEEIPNEPFDVFEKMDGSLGILYWVAGKPYVATRGSFTSEQAHRANRMLYDQYGAAIPHLSRDRTYLFEIIYAENRIVVDYGKHEKLVLLAVLDTETGVDLPLEDVGFPVVKQYHGIKDIATLRDLEQPNSEGFVVRFKSGFRVKVKFEEYVRLHRLVTQVSNKVIWEYMREGLDFDELLDRVPDEFYAWVRRIQSDLIEQYQSIETCCKRDFRTFDTRKEAAAYFKACDHPTILFRMLDGKPYEDLIWKRIKPEYQRPFALEI